MGLPENDYQILHLTEKFYEDYPNDKYNELLKKQGRAYNCLLFQTHYDYYICIPYRSEIKHKNAFLFKQSERSRRHKSGLDYSKMSIIKRGEYISTKSALIDKDEYMETLRSFEKIKKEALDYVEQYVLHHQGVKPIHCREYKRKYKYSTLRYFHEELNIK